MKITKLKEHTLHQMYLHLALDDAVAEYQKVMEVLEQKPRLTEETATPELMILHHSLEKKRVTALILAASCVEATSNLYLELKATSEQFVVLEKATFIEKWTVLPSFFVSGYTFPKDCELYQDLKRLQARRNALVHLKEAVSIDGVVLHQGSLPEIAGDEHAFVGRCRSLPERLVNHLASLDKTETPTEIKMIFAGVKTVLELMRGQLT